MMKEEERRMRFMVECTMYKTCRKTYVSQVVAIVFGSIYTYYVITLRTNSVLFGI